MKDRLVVPVSSILTRVNSILSQTMQLDSILIQGEVSNLIKHRSGHYYFSLKDEKSEISCVMFSNYVSRLSFTLKEGMKVLVSGNVKVYEIRGSLQLYVKEIQQDGIGDLYQELEKRRQLLTNEGYFLESHKKNKPKYISNIAVVTAKEGAALQDVLSTIHRRWPMTDVCLYSAYVQGTNAPASLIRQLKKADSNQHDAILIVRGGGSLEDLFCFNDVELVKTIYDLSTYTVSGVGHEVDTTLCDLVCDHRAVTPTAAAEWVTWNQLDVKDSLIHTKEKLNVRMHQLILQNRIHLDHIQTNPYIKDPFQWIIDKRLRLDAFIDKLDSSQNNILRKQEMLRNYQSQLIQNIKTSVENKKNNLSFVHSKLDELIKMYINLQKDSLKNKISLLDAYSPLKIMLRGYSIITKNEKIIRSINNVNIDDKIVIQVSDGKLNAIVTDKE